MPPIPPPKGIQSTEISHLMEASEGLCGLDIVTTNICCNVEACIGSQNFSPIDQSYKSVVMWRLVSAVKIFHPSTNPISLNWFIVC